MTTDSKTISQNESEQGNMAGMVQEDYFVVRVANCCGAWEILNHYSYGDRWNGFAYYMSDAVADNVDDDDHIEIWNKFQLMHRCAQDLHVKESQ